MHIQRDTQRYGVPLVSKLCILLIGRFSTKNRLDIFSNKISCRFLYKFQNIGLICDNKISSRSFVQELAKYRVDFLAAKYRADFSTNCKISGRFFGNKILSQTFAQVAKYPVQCHCKQHSTRFVW